MPASSQVADLPAADLRDSFALFFFMIRNGAEPRSAIELRLTQPL